MAAIRDPMAMDDFVYLEARDKSFWLPDKIIQMSEKDQEAHVRKIIYMAPEYSKHEENA